MGWVVEVPTGPRWDEVKRARFESKATAETGLDVWRWNYVADCDRWWRQHFGEERDSGVPHFVTRARIWEEP